MLIVFCFFSGLLIDWPPSALYVVDLVRFRQMAAGVRQALTLSLRVMKPTFHSVGYLA